MLHFFTRDWNKNNKKQFLCVEIGNDILILYEILITHAVSKTLKCLNTTGHDSYIKACMQ